MADWTNIDPENLGDNPFKLVGKDWMLITAGDKNRWNTMTASWGTLGVLWRKKVSFCFVRPSRHTFDFIENSDYYTLSFFGEEHRQALNFCGSKSGRDYDKAKETGLVPFETDNNTVSFEQARLVMVCKKLYTGNIKKEKFLYPEIIEDCYPDDDFHNFYVGEVVKVLSK